jgi:hypothetical protein
MFWISWNQHRSRDLSQFKVVSVINISEFKISSIETPSWVTLTKLNLFIPSHSTPIYIIQVLCDKILLTHSNKSYIVSLLVLMDLTKSDHDNSIHYACECSHCWLGDTHCCPPYPEFWTVEFTCFVDISTIWTFLATEVRYFITRNFY